MTELTQERANELRKTDVPMTGGKTLKRSIVMPKVVDGKICYAYPIYDEDGVDTGRFVVAK